MAILKRSEVERPTVPKETVPVNSLGGDVVVRGLLLSERLALYSRANADGKVFAEIPKMLAISVLDADELPLFSLEDWEAFGIKHQDEALTLFKVAQRLSGLETEDAKKN